ncbi:MAG: translocation/assembly module TamB domain-containing protein [Burkholderiales bacterium]|nr:translocation/assembly module TamB domain-containing protein [Burkholderiales bacterium]
MASESPKKALGRRKRWIGLSLAIFLLLIALMGVAAWLIGSESGARTAIAALSSRLPIQMQAEGVHGRLADALRIRRLEIQSKNQKLVLSDVRLAWRPWELHRGVLHVTSLRAAQLTIANKIDQQPEPLHLPDNIASPIALQFDSVQVDGGEIAWGPVTVAKFGGIAFDLNFDHKRYALNLQRLAAQSVTEGRTFAGDLAGQATLVVARPYALRAKVTSRGEAKLSQQSYGLQGRLDLNGSLAEIQAALDFRVRNANVKGRAIFKPFSGQAISDALVTARALNLADLDERLPHSALDLDLTADHSGSGRLSVKNTRSGPMDAHAIPLDTLEMEFRQQSGKFLFDRIRAARGPATLAGKGSYADGALALALQADRLDLRAINSRLQSTRLSGAIDLQHAAGKQVFGIELKQPLARQTASVAAHGELADQRLAIDRAHLALGTGRLDLSGHWDLAGAQTFAAEGRASHFRLQDIGRFERLPAIDINGNFSIRGARLPKLNADISFRINQSKIAEQALQGEGQAHWRTDRLVVPKLELTAGDNRLHANGELSQGISRLVFALDAPKLEQLGPDFGGQLRLNGNAGGNFHQPRVQAQWSANNLHLPSGLKINAFAGKAELEIGGSPRSPLQVDARAQGLAVGRIAVRELTLAANGTAGRHTVEASMSEEAQQWNVKAIGALEKAAAGLQWNGEIQHFSGAGRYVGRLTAPAALFISPAQVRLERARVEGDTAAIVIERFTRDADGIATRGRFERLQIAPFLKFSSVDPALATDLLLAGEWDVGIGDTVSGSFSVRRQSGDLVIKSSAPLALGLQRLDAKANADRGQLSLQFDAAGRLLGNVAVQMRAATGSGAGRFSIAPHSALAGSARIDVPSLAWAGPLISPAILTEGRMQGDIRLSGSAASPHVNGQIAGSRLRLFLTEIGVDLREGVLDASFQNDVLQLKNLSFQSGDGRVAASGPVHLGMGNLAAQIDLRAERFAVFNRSDRKLVVSGSGNVGLREGSAAVKGTVNVDSGFFDLGRPDMPQLSDDVVVLGREQKGAARLALSLDVDVGFGQGVALRGRGLEGVLTGQLHLSAVPKQTLRAQGALQVNKGTYAAYGRKLAIERGELRFSGPLNNPALDILAMRRGQEVEAGVAVRGTMLAPRATLVSEPSVPEAEKLSWLVLGRGLSGVGEGDVGSLQSAAGALLSEGAMGSVQSRLGSAIGLDDLNIGTSQNKLQQRIVTVGKQVSDRLYVGYEQGLETASSVLHLRYTLSRRLTLEAEAGARSALSLFFNFLFE